MGKTNKSNYEVRYKSDVSVDDLMINYYKNERKKFNRTMKRDNIISIMVISIQVLLFISSTIFAVLPTFISDIKNLSFFISDMLLFWMWFNLFGWNFYSMISSKTKSMMFLNGFVLLIMGFVVILNLLNIIINNTYLEIIFWTVLSIMMIYQLYVMFFNPYWFTQKTKHI